MHVNKCFYYKSYNGNFYLLGYLISSIQVNKMLGNNCIILNIVSIVPIPYLGYQRVR